MKPAHFQIRAIALLCAGALLLASFARDLAAADAPAAKVALPEVRGKAGAAAQPGKAFTHFRVGDRNVKRVLVDGGRIWVATSGGLIRYDPASDEYRLYDARSGLKSPDVVFVGKVGERIAASTAGGGFALLDARGAQWEHFDTGEGGKAVVQDVLRASNGDVWIATRAGVYRVAGGALRKPSTWTHFTAANSRNGLPSDRVYALAEGRNGDIWLATEAGVARHAKGKWSDWRVAQSAAPASAHAKQAGVHAGFVVAIAVDGAGHAWAGTLGGGLLRFDGSAWRRYTVAEGLPGDNVFALHRDASGSLWIATDKGLARMKDGKFRVMTTKDGLFANAVFSVAATPDALWAGSYGGVARIRGGS